MLEVNGISYRYTRKPWLFTNVSLHIKPGEIVGLYGASGAGKTTLAKTIAGYLFPQTGTISIGQGNPRCKGIYPVQLIWQHPEQSINPKWKMKVMLQEVPNLTVELLSLFGVQREWLDRFPDELSGGELQRFCVARAFSVKPKYVIADEMTTMLDSITQAQIWQIVLKMAKQHKIGILAISHDFHLLNRISNRIINFNEIGTK